MGNRISGVILAGGTNSRFSGKTKANAIVGGKTIIARIISTIEDLFDEIIIVTNTPDDFKDYDCFKIVSDQFVKTGPLGGIHAGLISSTKDAIFVFAGDMPFLKSELIIKQIEFYKRNDCEALVPQIGQFIEPLHAIYNKSIEYNLEKYLTDTKNYAVRDYIKMISTLYMILDGSSSVLKAFSNINSESDINKLKILPKGLTFTNRWFFV